MQNKQNSTALVWFRNNLRVQDNQSLSEAISLHKHVIAVYCFDPEQFEISDFGFKKTEKFRAKFLIETVQNLKDNLRPLNVELFVYTTAPKTALSEIATSFNISAIYLQKEWTFEEVQVSKEVRAALPKDVMFKACFDQFLYHPEDINISFDDVPQVFTNFRKHVEKQAKIRPFSKTDSATALNDITNSTAIPSLNDLGFEEFETHPNSAFPFNGGESSALQRLHHYFFETKKLHYYKKNRNGLVGTDYSSKFSPWLANGSISARTIYWQVKEFESRHFKNQSTYWLIFELIWRDYFKYISLKHGNAIFKMGGILQKDYPWKTDADLVKRWINGETSSDFVNANMLEIKNTGWMSNRGRQNVASYFSKDLLLDWRLGAAYFESMLIDYDVHSNYGNWMYVSGVGNDPRDRKFNTERQAKHYDASGKFQNLWLQTTLF